MSLRGVFQLGASVVLCGGMLFGDPVSFVGGYVGSYLDPGPGFSVSNSWPLSTSYSASQIITTIPGSAYTYSAAESTFGNLTTATLQASSGFTGSVMPSFSAPFEYVAPVSFSGFTVQVNGPVYLSESVTLNYSFAFNNYTSTDSGSLNEVLQFDNGDGSQAIGAPCTIDLPTFSLPGRQGTAVCSTARVFIGGPSTISINNSLSAFLDESSQAATGMFNGTATLGPLTVYDESGVLLQTINIDQLATPEPDCVLLVITGFVGILAAKRQNIALFR